MKENLRVKDMTTSSPVIAAKPSIVKDALFGLLSATLIGLIASVTFILAVLLLSSQAFADSQTNALTPAQTSLTAPTEREYFFQNTIHIYIEEDLEEVEV